MKGKTESSLAKFLKQPYPFYYRGQELLVICGILLVMSWAFNYFFEPFHVNPNEHKMDYFWVCFIHALVAPIILVILSILWPRRITEEKWIVKREILFLIIFLLTVGICQFLIRDVVYDNPNNWSFRYLYEEIRNTFLVGTLFISMLIPLNFTRLNAKYVKTAGLVNTTHDGVKREQHVLVQIPTNLKDDVISFDISKLLFAKAEGNYVEIYLKEDIINRVVKRTTMKEFESALASFENIMKTHRSYIVNLLHVKQVSGNAQGYKLYLSNYDDPVPVSRNMIIDFNSRMKQLR